MSVELVRLDAAYVRPPFSCGDEDIDEFFHKDSIEGATELVSVTYLWREDNVPVAFFSVSNDSIKKEQVPRSSYARLLKPLPRRKRYSSMPAVKIGRIGVAANVRRTGCGTRILDFLKVWFTQKNKTGCRFILVDAYNKAEVTAFYLKNGFVYLATSDEKEETRIMYFDLLTFSNTQAQAATERL